MVNFFLIWFNQNSFFLTMDFVFWPYSYSLLKLMQTY